MLHFFRKIRRDLLANSQFFKYLKYAVGEMVWVVLGILIALYINEWNKARLDIRYEKEILSDIQKDLQKELVLLKTWKEYTLDRIDRVSILDSLLREKTPEYNKSLDTLFGAIWGLHQYSLDHIAKYENLKSRGLDIIQVDSIKEQILILYEVDYRRFEIINDIEDNLNSDVILPYYLKNFTDANFRISATPVDFESVWEDHEYHNIVSLRLKVLQGNSLGNYNIIEQNMDHLNTMITNYLGQEN